MRDEKREKQEKIEDTMAEIRARMGKGAIRFGYYRNDEIGVSDHTAPRPTEDENAKDE